MYHPDRENGNAAYRSWMQIPEQLVSGFSEGSDSIALQDKRYALFSYLVNASTIGMDIASAMNVANDLSEYIITSGSYTYVMKAEPGSPLSGGMWQMKRIYEDGDEILVEWADGNANYDNIANDFASKVYST